MICKLKTPTTVVGHKGYNMLPEGTEGSVSLTGLKSGIVNVNFVNGQISLNIPMDRLKSVGIESLEEIAYISQKLDDLAKNDMFLVLPHVLGYVYFTEEEIMGKDFMSKVFIEYGAEDILDRNELLIRALTVDFMIDCLLSENKTVYKVVKENNKYILFKCTDSGPFTLYVTRKASDMETKIKHFVDLNKMV